MLPIFLLSEDKFALVNRAYLRLVGAEDASQILGRSFLEFAAPESRKHIERITRSFFTGETPPDIFEIVGARLDGSTFSCEIFPTQFLLKKEPVTLVHLSDITDRKLSAEKLEFMGTHDSLTGLYNRAYFDQILALKPDPAKQPFTILILDVNGLKKVNDTFGHAAGDEILQDTAKTLLRAMRGEDVVARIGGDEFVVVMPSTDQESAKKVVARIQTAIQAHNENHLDHQPVSVAIGCATLNVDETLVDAVKRANSAMYIHKRERTI